MTFQELTQEVARREGGRVNQSIAEISEAVARTLDVLSEQPASEVLRLLEVRRGQQGF